MDQYIYKRGAKFVVYFYDEFSKKARYQGTYPSREAARAAQTGTPVRPPKAARRSDCFDNLAGFYPEGIDRETPE